MTEGILRAGRAQLAERGADKLSLREIARELGVASSAVYRYVSSRDELLTILLIDSFTDLANTVDAALDGSESSPAGQLRTLAESMRAWALEHPAQWALLYGSPVAGYSAPETTVSSGIRVMRRVAEILAQGSRSASASGLSAGYEKALRDAIEETDLDMDPSTLAEALVAWMSLVGVISGEVFGQLGAALAAFGQESLDQELRSICQRFALS
ncbi:putative HTH-type transcriptional regulator [Acidipropionibacterium virtanenii]|uniref:Putative HTH-type transcriptional regulator n=2 Tax=Acidipropionibacterium virtanenii TaxID=2057246 RepID=A0A344UXV4_9ACTN|nr:putative HTH-type transcriptional regulator [Acidipropionibacterium virtanenii]